MTADYHTDHLIPIGNARLPMCAISARLLSISTRRAITGGGQGLSGSKVPLSRV